MSQAVGRSPIHRIIATFSRAVEALHLGVPPLFVERWGIAVHQCLSSRAREFHTHQHVLELVENADPLETLGALYHDTVYVQVDLGVPEHFASLLQPLIRKEEAGWRVLPHAASDPAASEVLAVFGRKAHEVLTPFTGLNELASALVAIKELEGVLSRGQLLAVAACIEGTIPFREDKAFDALAERLKALALPEAEVTDLVRRAVRLSNNDVGNFADPDPARFLDNTWKLLPETNPALHTASTYSVREYRVALMKMEGFLAQLPPERVFRRWGAEPAPEAYEARVAVARRNMALGVRYLRCKLYSTALVEALAVESGGDVPLDYFMGGLPEPGGPRMKRVEQFLPQPARARDVDGELLQLLKGGRATPSSFDISPSPLATFLYSAQGEASVMAGVEVAQAWWAGKLSARDFLARQPRDGVVGLAEATTHIADTRAEALRELVKLLK
ncbi:MAG: hypothetical protein IT380_19585 [Myxococcales bacterium]|nr:hypothetical protein [Myxococcales bacterium]